MRISLESTSVSRDSEGTYVFTDGSTFTKTGGAYGESNVSWSFAFTAWKAGQPGLSSHGSQDCVRSDSDGLWDDLGCSKELNYACQLPPNKKGEFTCSLTNSFYKYASLAGRRRVVCATSW